jgi:hypothetical protein
VISVHSRIGMFGFFDCVLWRDVSDTLFCSVRDTGICAPRDGMSIMVYVEGLVFRQKYEIINHLDSSSLILFVNLDDRQHLLHILPNSEKFSR